MSLPPVQPTTPPAPNLRPESVPVTQAMLCGVRDEWIHRLGALEGRLEAKFDSRFEAMDSKIQAMDSKFDSKLSNLSAEVSRLGVLIGEQNARNQVVLEGLSGLFHRQEKVEKDVKENRDEIRELIRALGKRVPGPG